MAKTIPADFIGKENLGYALVAFLSDSAKAQVTSLLNELADMLPGVLWTMPPEQLHVTLCEIIQPKTYSQDKEALFAARQQEYLSVPAEIIATIPKFTLTFDTIEASQQAVIIKASDSSQLNNIRAKLVASMQLPDETRTPPNITHSSIARYLKEADLESVQNVVAGHSIAIHEEISEFKLVRTKLLPMQSYETLRTYPLASSPSL